MLFGKSPDRGRWHIIDGALTACHRGRAAGQVSSDWVTIDRLPPRHDQHCFLCFPWHVPPAADVPATDWDLDGFIETL